MSTALKTYVLEEHLRPTAPIYVVAGKNKRSRIDAIPYYRPYLTYTFTDESGMQKTIRFKANSNTIDLAEQIASNIPANAKFTSEERRMLRFTNGVLMTNIKIVQDYLEATPEYNGFKGKSQRFKKPMYRLLDRAKKIKSENKSFRDTVAAANKITGLNLKQAQDLLIKIYGTYFKVPSVDVLGSEELALEECQNLLIKYLDEHGDKAVEEINKENFSFDEEIKVLLGRLVGAELISFVALPNTVAKKKNDKWISVKEIPNSLAEEERMSQFVNFLSTKEGSTLLADLKNMATTVK